MQTSALHIDGVDESIDDTDTDADDPKHVEVWQNPNWNILKKAKTRSFLFWFWIQKKSRPSLVATDGEAMLAGAEDSDYYTPEEPHTTILSPLCPEKVWR